MPSRLKLDFNKKYGRLKLLTEIRVGGSIGWLCLCDCGKKTRVRVAHLVRGRVKSCGCLQAEIMHNLVSTHGMSNSPEYQAYQNMKTRCLNTKDGLYKDWGGRGIKICDRWLQSFENFLADIGMRPSSEHSLDRINNNGNYEPGNCRWGTREQQANNKRFYKYVNY